MATAAQINANHANAHLSTGPRTPEGKARVAHNAVRHGLTAKHLIVRPDERAEFDEFHRSLLAELDPQGAVESITFDEILHAAWNLRRFRRIEAECFTTGSDPLIAPESAGLLDRLSRYQARAQRAYYRALQELRVLQTNRALRASLLDENAEEEVPAMADIDVLTKQSQFDVETEAVKRALELLDFQGEAMLASHRSRSGRPAAQAQSGNPATRL